MAAAPRGPRRHERAAVLVEFALVLPVLMMILLGTFSGAVAWNQSQSLGQGARVAVRYASTLPLPPTDAEMAGWLDGIAERAVDGSAGDMAEGVDGRTICVAYVDPAGAAADETVSRTIDAAGVATSGASWCFDDGQGETERRVQVVLERDGYLDVGIYRTSLHLRRAVAYRYEAHGGL